MSQVITSGMRSWVQALESSHRDLRVVSAQLEAEFERTYCRGAGASSAAVNPARLVARLSALEAAVPAAADAVLALARTELDATRAARATANSAVAATELLNAITPQIGGGDSCEGDIDEGDELEGELQKLCERLAHVSATTTRSNSKLVSSESKGTDDYLDKALLSAGLASVDGEDEDCALSQCNLDVDEGHKPLDRRGTEKEQALTKNGQRKKKLPDSSTQRKRNGKENAGKKKSQAAKPHSRPVDPARPELQYSSIPKPEYQRLPRMLKQQAKLEELNVVYSKVFELLSAHTAPMPEDELLLAIGVEDNKCIDVLRRGFSLLKRGRDGWSLGKTAPPQTVGRSRPPLDPSAPNN